MTLLFTSVQAETAEELRVRVERAFAAGAEAVELRLDGLDRVDGALVEWVGSLPLGRWIATCRPTTEGGRSQLEPEQRLAMLQAVGVRWKGLIDFEYSDWMRCEGIRRTLRAAVSEVGSGEGLRLILSHHDFNGRPEDPGALLGAIVEESGKAGIEVVPKLAWKPETICDCLEALELTRSSPVSAIVTCMGEAGVLSRVLAGKVGAFGTYCAPEAGKETAPGQVSLSEMLERYRWALIGPQTRVFGVIGWPVAHSMGPLIHNAAFAESGIDAVYLPLAVDPEGDTLETFLDGCLERDWLRVGGFSVTVPHKARTLAYLGDRADAMSRRIGAVNTLVVSDGQYRGTNTDCCGALDALTDGLGCDRDDLRGTSIDVLGAGGAARAVVAGLRACGCSVSISNIIPEDAVQLGKEFDCAVREWDERHRGEGSVLVNCTSVGMWPEVGSTPLPADSLANYDLVFDVVYNPLETRLLREAASAGCRTIGGVEMFVQQAAAQLEAWTNKRPDTAAMRQRVLRALKKRDK